MTTGKKILLVDDDAALRQSLAEQLTLLGDYESHEAETAAVALARVRKDRFDAILLDAGLPDMDGRTLCRLLRAEGVGCPIVLLTPAGPDAGAGPDPGCGANDRVAKPVRLGLLLARLRALLNPARVPDDAAFPLGPYIVHPAAKLLVDGERRIRLTEKEIGILTFLHRAGDRAIDRDTLLGEVWGYNSGVTTHTLETHVYRLRQKIERDPGNARLLVTEPGGYRLVPNA